MERERSQMSLGRQFQNLEKRRIYWIVHLFYRLLVKGRM
jgi:hypothetical protein